MHAALSIPKACASGGAHVLASLWGPGATPRRGGSGGWRQPPDAGCGGAQPPRNAIAAPPWAAMTASTAHGRGERERQRQRWPPASCCPTSPLGARKCCHRAIPTGASATRAPQPPMSCAGDPKGRGRCAKRHGAVRSYHTRAGAIRRALALFRCFSFERREVFHQQPVNKDVSTAGFAQEDPLGRVVQEAHVAERHHAIPPQHQAQGEV